MGIFDLLSPLFSLLDGILKLILPSLARILFWGLLGSGCSMWLYVSLSSQKKLASINKEIVAVRKALAKYKGSFEGAKTLINRSLLLSLKQVGLVIRPALLGSLPMIFLLIWITNFFSYNMPKTGEIIRVNLLPKTAEVQWQPSTNLRKVQESGTWELSWPSLSEKIQLQDSLSQIVTSFPLNAPIPMLYKRQWWNWFFGNPAGYIPNNSSLEKIEINLTKTQYISFLPQWLSSAEALFLVAALIGSLTIKFIFHIH